MKKINFCYIICKKDYKVYSFRIIIINRKKQKKINNKNTYSSIITYICAGIGCAFFALLLGGNDIITFLLTSIVTPILPYLLSFAAGAMIYVVVEELIPESQAGEHSNIGTIGVAIGFVIMMILDVALG